MVARNEEEIEESFEAFREKALKFIPLHRFNRRAPGARDMVESSRSLKALSDEIGSFLELIRPIEGELLSPQYEGENSYTTELSVYLVIEKNLLFVKREIDSYREETIEIEDYVEI